MTLIKGITATLYERTQTGTDAFGSPTFTETAVSVDNVLIAPVSQDDLTSASPAELYGRKAICRIAIPKGDNHEWENNRVSINGHTYRVFGPAEEGIESMIPLSWHRIYKVERVDDE